jgi:hypothetical protein
VTHFSDKIIWHLGDKVVQQGWMPPKLSIKPGNSGYRAPPSPTNGRTWQDF